jgi:hypothetical protein
MLRSSIKNKRGLPNGIFHKETDLLDLKLTNIYDKYSSEYIVNEWKWKYWK